MNQIKICHLSSTILMLICIGFFCCPTPCLSEQFNEADNEYPAQKYRGLVERHVKDIKILSERYSIDRNQIIKGKDFISEEKDGSNYIVKIFDKNLGKEVTLYYFEFRSGILTLTQAVAFGKGTGFSMQYSFKNCEIVDYYEVKDDKVDGVRIGFYDNGVLSYFMEYKDNALLGIRLEWRPTGELRKFIEYKKPYTGTSEKDENDPIERIMINGEITISKKSLIIGNKNINVKTYQYNNPIYINYINKSQAQYHTPEHAAVSLLSAVEFLDYNWWLQGWVDKSGINPEEYIKQLPPEFKNWFKDGKLWTAHHALYRRTDYICNGQLYVLIGYKLTTSDIYKNASATSVLVFKKTEGGWRATLDLTNDPVYNSIDKWWLK